VPGLPLVPAFPGLPGLPSPPFAQTKVRVLIPGGTTNVPVVLKVQEPPAAKPPKTPILVDPIAIIFS
jgi:hypothetical protein